MNFGRHGFRKAGMSGGFFKNYQNQFKNYNRMQCYVNMARGGNGQRSFWMFPYMK